jgi:NADH-quinone oxidoreductase subunit L
VLALIPLLPFVGFLLNATVGRRLPKSVSGGVATAAMGLAFGVALAAVWRLLQLPAAEGVRALDQHVYTWFASGGLNVALAFRLDPLASVMVLVITGIGTLIHLYSTAYMHEESDAEFARYFSYLNLFAAFMLVLVLGSNFPVMFVGWEGVGLCSYLLIGFWFKKKSASDAGKKAFIVNRVGDFGFILGMLWLFALVGTLDFQEVAARVAAMPGDGLVLGGGAAALTGITLLLFLGATGKSAQLPLHIWLPDAMEGPTPVSALIHAATMVTAGVYMIGRNAVLFSHAPGTLEVVAVVGCVTALMAGTIGLVQTDIKRVLAYSTVSQLGYMFLAMGVGAFAAGIFHLYTHAFFKALLFLGSGAVIHALHGEQDLRRMGGLKRELPITYWTFLIGTLAIAGVPLLSGFFSKDEILWKTFSGGHPVLWGLAVVTALLTATYMFRLLYLTFFGERRTGPAEVGHHDGAHAGPATAGHHGGTLPGPAAAGHHGSAGHLHDAPPAMAIALVVLAIGSVVAGYVGIPHALGGHNQIDAFLEPSFHAPGGAEAAVVEPAAAAGEAHDDTALELSLMGLSTLVAFAGIGLATMLYLRRPGAAASLANRFRAAHGLLLNKYYVDELYEAVIVQPVRRLSTGVLWRVVDAGVVDGIVNGVGLAVRGWSAVLRRLQTGSVRAYAMSMFLAAVAIVGYYLWR